MSRGQWWIEHTHVSSMSEDKKKTDNQKECPQVPMFNINLLTLYGAKEGRLYGKIWNYCGGKTKIRKP